MTDHHEVRVGRVYDERTDAGGLRVLVDRIWPRGLTKARADLDHWFKTISPSTELRQWYAHDPDRFDDFARRYRAELAEPERADAFARLRDLAAEQAVTLLTATKHPEISEAAVLAHLIDESPAG